MKCQTFSASCPASVESVELCQCTQSEDFSHELITTEAWTLRQTKLICKVSFSGATVYLGIKL